jgi:hypothetical protein
MGDFMPGFGCRDKDSIEDRSENGKHGVAEVRKKGRCMIVRAQAVTMKVAK